MSFDEQPNDCVSTPPREECEGAFLSLHESIATGRFVVAARDIPAGTLVHMSLPYAVSMLPSALKSRCRCCFKKLPEESLASARPSAKKVSNATSKTHVSIRASDTLLTCRGCGVVHYCSHECLAVHHRYYHSTPLAGGGHGADATLGENAHLPLGYGFRRPLHAHGTECAVNYVIHSSPISETIKKGRSEREVYLLSLLCSIFLKAEAEAALDVAGETNNCSASRPGCASHQMQFASWLTKSFVPQPMAAKASSASCPANAAAASASPVTSSLLGAKCSDGGRKITTQAAPTQQRAATPLQGFHPSSPSSLACSYTHTAMGGNGSDGFLTDSAVGTPLHETAEHHPHHYHLQHHQPFPLSVDAAHGCGVDAVVDSTLCGSEAPFVESSIAMSENQRLHAVASSSSPQILQSSQSRSSTSASCLPSSFLVSTSTIEPTDVNKISMVQDMLGYTEVGDPIYLDDGGAAFAADADCNADPHRPPTQRRIEASNRLRAALTAVCTFPHASLLFGHGSDDRQPTAAESSVDEENDLATEKSSFTSGRSPTRPSSSGMWSLTPPSPSLLSSSSLSPSAQLRSVITPTYCDVAAMVSNVSVVGKERAREHKALYHLYVKLRRLMGLVQAEEEKDFAANDVSSETRDQKVTTDDTEKAKAKEKKTSRAKPGARPSAKKSLAAPSSSTQSLMKNTTQQPYPFLPEVSESIFISMCAVLQCNSFGVFGSDDKCCAIGIYPFASYFNHSCDPNLGRVMVGDELRFYALRPIPAGDPLVISYVDVEDATAKRRQTLLEAYRFYCRCSRCAGEGKLQAALCHLCPAKGYLRPLLSTPHMQSKRISSSERRMADCERLLCFECTVCKAITSSSSSPKPREQAGLH